MRKLLFIALFLISTISFSQSPQFLNYQAVARDASGTIVTNPIGIKFEILQGSASGTLVYEETNNITPSSAGVFTAAIGGGSPVVGTFSSINWANSPYFIRVSIDPTGGTSYSTVGTSQLLSVPYALYAEKAGNSLTAGSGINITGGVISNASPNQTVNLSGPNVIGTYPNYTVTSGSTYSAGAYISISSGSIINTAPDQTVTLVSAGISSITGTYPTFTVDVPAPTLAYNSGTQVLTLTQGSAITTATITTSSTSVSITGPGVTGSYPNYTITPPPATSIISTGSSILVNGTSPSFTIVPNPSLTVTGNQLSIVDGNTVTLPTGTTYTNGVGIAFTSGTVITNTAPDQTVTIGSGTNVNVTGTYPNFVVNATPSLSIAGNILSITGGTSVVLPAPPTLTAGVGISIVGGTITNTAPNQTVTVSGPGVIGTYPSYTVTAPPATTVAAGNNIVVTGASPSYTVNSPTYSLSFANSSTGVLTNGINNTSVALPQPTLTLSGTNSNVISAGSNSITIPTYTAGSGLVLSGTAPNFTLATSSTGTSTAWNTLGNTGTIDGTNFIGTSDNIPFNIRVNNQRSGYINNTNNVTFFGYQAGFSNSGVTDNSAFGHQALYSNTTGAENAAFGWQALYFNTTGVYNTAVGRRALYSNTTGNQNTAIGSHALYSNTTGTANTASGWTALNYNTTGSNNTASGFYSLFNNISGINNTSNGMSALYANTTGSFNTASGVDALYSNTSGPRNTAYGNQALYSNTTGNDNNATGYQALYSNSGGGGNVATGNYALYSNTGSNNVATGPNALYSNTTGGANVALGNSAGYSNSVGSQNVFLGHQAGYFETGSNKLYIANSSANPPLIYGDFSTARIGLGTISPQAKLDISGGSTYFRPNSSDVTKILVQDYIGSAQRIYSDASAGTPYDLILGTYPNGHLNQLVLKQSNAFVGVGTAIPGYKMHVNTPSSGGGIGIEASSASITEFDMVTLGTGSTALNNPGTRGWTFWAYGNSFGTSSVQNDLRISSFNGTGQTDVLFLDNGGNIGVGTTAPVNKLHVNGGVTITDGSQGAGKVFTSDGTGNGTWQAPFGGSRMRSITVDPNDIDFAFTTIPPTKIMLGGWQRPCINFPDGSITQIQSNIPIPSDWNGTSNFTVEILYSSPGTAGNFDIIIGTSNVGLNVNAASPTSGTNYTGVPSGVGEGLMALSHSVFTTSTDRMIQIYIRRDGTSAADNSVQPMHFYGFRLKYMD